MRCSLATQGRESTALRPPLYRELPLFAVRLRVLFVAARLRVLFAAARLRVLFFAALLGVLFFAVPLRVLFFAVPLRVLFFAVLLRGTFAPFSRASDSPIAMACLRLLTVPPLPPFPLLRVPRLRRFIALFTLLPAASPYFRLVFLAGIVRSFDLSPCEPEGDTHASQVPIHRLGDV
jgi:hypothetical protein